MNGSGLSIEADGSDWLSCSADIRHVPIPKLLGSGFGVLGIVLGFGVLGFVVLCFVVLGFVVLRFGQFWVWFWDLGFGYSIDFNLVMENYSYPLV